MEQKNKIWKTILREIIIFAGIYAVWNVYMSIKNPYPNVNSDALVPCLFYLPPLGLYILYFALIKYGLLIATGSWIKKKKIFRRIFRKKKT